MQHDLTIICEDIRRELGRKISLIGIYDEAIIFKRVPARMAKLCMFQRWSGSDQPEKIRIQIQGSALPGAFSAEAERDRAHFDPDARRSNLMIAFAPFDVVDVGEVEFLTYFGDTEQPSHSHRIEIRIDPDMTE
jgi:hypothetical protein